MSNNTHAVDFTQCDHLTLKGQHYPRRQLEELVGDKLNQPALPGWEEALYTFINEWLNKHHYVLLRTSGSTGPSKPIRASKNALLRSALNTLEFFDLQPGHTALLCLSCRYIAGKMMVVRALAGGLNLIPVPVDGHPLNGIETSIDFAAMTPYQMYSQMETDSSRLHLLKSVILGGSAVEPLLVKKLQQQPFRAWETYGMTETLSHVALKPLNGPHASAWFTPLPNIGCAADTRGCLTIEAPGITSGMLTTNDLVEFKDGLAFRVRGRIDHVINSGGVKINPAETEALIAPLLPGPFVISSVPHPTLGRQVVLVTEHAVDDPPRLLEEIKKRVPPYHAPTRIIVKNPLPRTPNGKIQRHLVP